MSAEPELDKLERKVLRSSGINDWLRRVDTLRQLSQVAEPDEDVIKGIVLALNPPSVEAQARAAVLDAYALGAKDALAIVTKMPEVEKVSRIGRPGKEPRGIVSGLDREGRDAVTKAQKLARVGAAIDNILAPLFGHANGVRSRVGDAINLSGNEGSTAVADAADLPTVWVAETDACVRCLAYSGQVADPGADFPAGLTFGRKGYGGPLPHPPLHPHCRCTVEPLRAPEYAAGLRREANRSVLRGYSLESESMAVRLDAAARLVDQAVAQGGNLGGWDVPKSVLAYARKSVANGAFSTRGR